jgi:hypothetical protein
MGIRVLVDWDNDGSFTQAYDDISADIQSVEWFLGARRAWQSACDEPTCTINVRNTDKKYTPENSASPIYGKIKPNRRIRIMDADTGTQLWNGYLDLPQINWRPAGEMSGRETVVLQGVGAKQLLDRIQVELATYENVTIDVIIKDVLRKAGIFLPLGRGWFLGVTGYSELGVTTYIIGASSWSDFEVGLTNIPFYGDEVVSVWATITQLVNTERGKFYIDRDGKYILHNRQHNYQTANNNTIDESVLTGFDYAFGADVQNSVRVDGNPRRQTATETLWELEAPETIAVGQIKEFEVRLRRETGQFAGAKTLSATPTFSGGTAVVTVTPRGGIAVIKVDNTAGAVIATLSTLVLTGSATYSQNAIRVTEVDQLSIADVGRNEIVIDAGLTGDIDTAGAIALTELGRRTLKGAVRSVSMRNKWVDRKNDYMFLDNRIGYFVRVTLGSVEHDKRYLIVGERHSWTVGDIHSVTFYLEPLPVNDGFRWDVSNWDEDYWVH